MINFSLTDAYKKDGSFVPMNHVMEENVTDFGAFIDLITSKIDSIPETTNKRDCPRFAPGIFQNNERSGDNFKGSDLLVLDIDTIHTVEEFFKDIEGLFEKDVSFMLFGSPSNTEETPKFRLILPLSSTIHDTKMHKYGYEETAKSVLSTNGYELDLHCRDSAHFFYIPPRTQKDSIVSNIGKPITFTYTPNEQLEAEKEETETLQKNALLLAPSDEVLVNFQNIIEYLGTKKASITHTYPDWLAVAFSCVSMRNHTIAKVLCLEAFQKISDLDIGRKNHADTEAQIRQFNICWDESQDSYSIGTIYKFALDLGWKFPIKYTKSVELVCSQLDQKFYYLSYPNTETDSIIPLYEPAFPPLLCSHTVTAAYPNKFQLQEMDVGYFDDADNNKYKYLSSNFLLSRRNTYYPTKKSFVLGQKRKGVYYDRKKDELVYATHSIAPATPIFSDIIDKYIKQLNVDTDWFYTYLYYFTDCTKALPWLHLFGVAGTGKSFMALLLGSLFTSEPDSTFFKKALNGSGFKQSAGNSPVLWMDEYIPDDATTLKELVTNNAYGVDQKWKGDQIIRGYHRLISSVNADSVNLPQDEKTDFSAMVRRVQIIEYVLANAKFLEDVGGEPVTKNWISFMFRNHVAYVRENPQEFNLLPPSSDIIVVKPNTLNSGNSSLYGASSQNKAILEYVISQANAGMKTSSLNINIDIGKLQSGLVEERVTQKRMPEADLKGIIKKAVGCNIRKRKGTNGEGRWELPYKNIKELEIKMGLDFDEEEGE